MCGSGKGGSSTSGSVNTTTPPAYLDSAYQALVSQAQKQGSTTYQPYTGELVAPLNGTQNQAISQIGSAQGAANPYINSASSAVSASQNNPWASTAQFSPDAVSQYESPYQQQVVNATEAEINQTNAQQQSQLQGNAASQHALGGDRSGIAAASLANQQGLAANQTLAQLNNQNYSQALGEFNTQQQSQLGANEATNWLNSQAANTYGNLGNEALSTDLTGSNALLSAGSLQQSTAQAQDTSAYNQFEQAQAYPYQQEDWLSGILTGVGGVGGGTTSGTGTTSQAGASPFSQILGLGESGLGAAGEAGGFGSLFKSGGIVRNAHNYRRGGIVPHLASGGSSAPTDYLTDVSIGWIPKPASAHGHANFPGAYRDPGVKNNNNGLGDISGAAGLMSGSNGNGKTFSTGIDGATGNNNATQTAINNNFVNGNASNENTVGDGSPVLVGINGTGAASNPLSGSSGFLGSSAGDNLLNDSGRVFSFNKGGRARHEYAIGGEVLPDIVSGVGDIVGAFFGDPGAGNQGVSVLNALDGGKTGGLTLRSGGVAQRAHMASGGIFGSLGAARHMAPRINLPKTPDLLNVPKFRGGGRIGYDSGGGVGGLVPTAQNANPIAQSQYSNISSLPVEQLRELAVRYPPNSAQGMMIQRALMQKQSMPATMQQSGQQATAASPLGNTGQTGQVQHAPTATNPSAVAASGQNLQTPQYADGGSTSDDDQQNETPQQALQPMPDVSQLTPAQNVSKYKQLADKNDARFDVKPDPWQSLLETGFATMAGNSRSAGVNIGQGALAGMKNYNAQQQSINDKAYKEGEIDNAVNRLDQEADFHKDAVNHQEEQSDIERNRDENQKSYQQGMLGLDQQKAAQQAKYQQGMLDWRNSSSGAGGKGGAVESLANRIMDETSDDQGNPTISFEEALSRAKASGATGTQQTKEDGILRKNAVDLYQNRVINDETGKPYTMTEALNFYGIKPTGKQAASPVSAATTSPAGAKINNLPAPPPPVGAVIKGYQYLGGDPSQQSSWKQQ